MTTTTGPVATPDALVTAYYERYREHDASGMASLYHADATLEVDSVRVAGREAIRGFWAAWFTAFPDVSSVVQHRSCSAAGFALTWTESGTHLGPLQLAGRRFEPTGRTLEWSGRSDYEVVDGRIARARIAVDLAPLQKLLMS